ncbi:hypothetical protein [Streptomyces sp. XH2]|uniref:hypothetical protein n=1 Tax=Streptomyces sp. XH2 TaxID=3412483 RepID=UPI003C7A5BF5
MPTPSSLRRALPAVLLSASLLISGCAGSDSQPDSAGAADPGSSSPAGPPSSALPDGIVKPGSAQPVAGGAWTVTLQGLERLPAETSRDVPAGSSAYAARLTVANQRSRIATAPRTELTARYGALGRQAGPMAGAAAAQAKPGAAAPVRVGPNASVTQEVRLVFPDQAQGQPVTVTVEATPEGLAQPELLFFESPLPGRPAASPEPQGPEGAGDRQGATPLGQWHGGLRLSTVSVTGEGEERTAHLELSVANRGGDPLRGLGTTLRVLTGRDLHLAATVHPVYGYHDAAIAPHRTATQAVTFRVPQSAVGGPVTIEAVGVDGSRSAFEGKLG